MEWKVGRFAATQSDDLCHVFTAHGAPRLDLQLHRDVMVARDRIGTRRERAVPVERSQLHWVTAWMIGGPAKKAWGLQAITTTNETILMLSGLSEPEARSLADMAVAWFRLGAAPAGGPPPPSRRPAPPTSSRAASRGPMPPPPRRPAPVDDPPAEDSWSVDEWRNRPPIGE